MKLSFVFIGLFLIQNSMAQINRVNGGLLIPSAQKANATIQPVIVPGASPTALPPKVDNLKDRVPFPGNQGTNQASCSAWATVYGLKSYQEAVEGNRVFKDKNNINKSHIYSPAYVFNQVHKSSQPCSTGVLLLDVLDVLKDDGVVTFNDMPYDENDCSRQPTKANKDSANKYAIDAHFTVFNFWKNPQSKVDILKVKERLSKGYPIVVAMHIDNNFKNNKFIDEFIDGKIVKVWRKFDPNNPSLTDFCDCYHAMLCIGYDDTKRIFTLLNSWGDKKANEGYIYVSYDVFEKSVKEAYYSEDKPNTRKKELSVNSKQVIEVHLNKVNKSSLKEFKFGVNELPLFQRDSITNIKYYIDFEIPEGSFAKYDDLTIGLLDVEKENKYAIIKLIDNKSSRALGNLKIMSNKSFLFDYNRYLYAIDLNKIETQKGDNPVKKATFRILKSDLY